MAVISSPLPLLADTNGYLAEISAFTGGAEILPGGVEIGIDEVAEDGHSVPVMLRAHGAREIALFSPANPFPVITVAHFGRLAATAVTRTRIRLADSQELIALARMTDGRIRGARRRVTVVVGGCNVGDSG